MSAEAPLLEVGRIGKAHGLKGEVVVDFVTNRVEERTALGTTLVVQRAGSYGGDDELLEVVAARPHQKKWLLTFDGVVGREAAEALRGAILLAPAIDDPDELFVHELIDRKLVDQHGIEHGVIVAVIDNPASDLLELDSGRLVPLAFVEESDLEHVRVSVPPGLLDDDTLG